MNASEAITKAFRQTYTGHSDILGRAAIHDLAQAVTQGQKIIPVESSEAKNMSSSEVISTAAVILTGLKLVWDIGYAIWKERKSSAEKLADKDIKAETAKIAALAAEKLPEKDKPIAQTPEFHEAALVIVILIFQTDRNASN